jgi:hypothetical protein
MDFEAVQRGEVRIKPNPVFFEPSIETPKPAEEVTGKAVGKESGAAEVPEEKKPTSDEQPEKKGPFSFIKKMFSKKEKIDIENEELPAYLREMPDVPTPQLKTLMNEPFNPQSTGGPRVTAEPHEIARESFGPGLADVEARKFTTPEPNIPKPPVRPTTTEAEDERAFAVPDEKKIAKNRFILIIGILFVLAATGYVVYAYLNRPKTEVVKEKPKEEVVIPPAKIKPAPLIQYDAETSIDAGASDIAAALKKYSADNNTAGTMTNIYVKKGDEYLTFSQVVEKLQMHPPQKLLDSVASYNLVLFNESDNKKRAGFVIKIKDQDAVDRAMLEWENTITVNNDAVPLFMGESYANPTAEDFQENTYKNIFIRYQNFANPDLTLDYAMFSKQSILIIGTSKNMAFELINRVLNQ